MSNSSTRHRGLTRGWWAAIAVVVTVTAGTAIYVPLGGDADSRNASAAPSSATTSQDTPTGQSSVPGIRPETAAEFANAATELGLPPMPRDVYDVYVDNLVAIEASPEPDLADNLEIVIPQAELWKAEVSRAVVENYDEASDPESHTINYDIGISAMIRGLTQAALCVRYGSRAGCAESISSYSDINFYVESRDFRNSDEPEFGPDASTATVDQLRAANQRFVEVLADRYDIDVPTVVVEQWRTAADTTDDPPANYPLLIEGDYGNGTASVRNDLISLPADGVAYNESFPLTAALDLFDAHDGHHDALQRCGQPTATRYCDALPYWRALIVHLVEQADR